MYREIKPINQLKKYIQSYWIISDIQEDSVISVEPDGCFDIVIDIADDGINTVTLSGIWEEIVKVKLIPGVTTVGVRFFPNSLETFFSLNISEIKNATTRYEKSMRKSDNGLDIGILYTSNSVEEITSFFDIYFLAFINSNRPNSVFDIIHQIESDSKVKNLAELVPMSTRQLNRLFQKSFGITTKNYINIIRFIKAKEMLLEGKSQTEIAHECGYYDQSHFSKEFKKYTQVTPSRYNLE